MGYFIGVILQTVVLPIVSGTVELVLVGGGPFEVYGRWWVFWGVGTRLLVAGIVQVVRPQMTAEILGSGRATPAELHSARELSTANIGMGLAGLLALVPAWAAPAGVAGGVFLLLDATVNPALPDADTSRACLYLKNMEPNIVNGAEANLRFVLGPMTIARANEIAILPQWQMELDTGGLPFFREVMDTAADSALPLSRLYRWSQALTLPGGSERLLLCAAPLLSAQGEVMGLCGFEMSEMLFKLAQAPTNGDYTYLCGCLAPFDGDWLRLTGGLYAGTPPDLTGKLQDLTIAQGDGAFHSYSPGNQSAFAGLHQEISLYPADSAFAGERWATALMLPEPVLNVLVSGQNHRLTASLLILMLVDIALAAFLSRRYIRPVAAALEQLKHPAAAGRTKIPEIDDLIEFLAAEDAAAEAGAISQPGTTEEHSALYRDFVHNIGLLSKAERKVFNLYLQGHTAQEIAGILTISINTVKKIGRAHV